MKAKPIVFSGERIKAILEGRKTQTRRVIKPDKYKIDPDLSSRGVLTWEVDLDKPPWQAGSRLWVREKFAIECPYGPVGECDNPDHIIYWSTEEQIIRDSIVAKWAPSIFMPRWASRITLEILDVRAERVQEISLDDIKSEGVTLSSWEAEDYYVYRQTMRQLWDKINKKRGYGWEVNPWVWVIEFKVKEDTDNE